MVQMVRLDRALSHFVSVRPVVAEEQFAAFANRPLTSRQQVGGNSHATREVAATACAFGLVSGWRRAISRQPTGKSVQPDLCAGVQVLARGEQGAMQRGPFVLGQDQGGQTKGGV